MEPFNLDAMVLVSAIIFTWLAIAFDRDYYMTYKVITTIMAFWTGLNAISLLFFPS